MLNSVVANGRQPSNGGDAGGEMFVEYITGCIRTRNTDTVRSIQCDSPLAPGRARKRHTKKGASSLLDNVSAHERKKRDTFEFTHAYIVHRKGETTTFFPVVSVFFIERFSNLVFLLLGIK